jgi:hypothetical protein
MRALQHFGVSVAGGRPGGDRGQWRVVLVCRRTGRSRSGTASGESAGGEKTDAGTEQDREARCAGTGYTPARGTLPEVWIPPAGLRDLRGLMRPRLAMRCQASVLKNRIHAAIRRYGLREDAFRDLFPGKARIALPGYIDSLPANTRFATTQEWQMLDQMERHNRTHGSTNQRRNLQTRVGPAAENPARRR